MRQYFKSHKEVITLIIAFFIAIFSQYLRIAHLNIAFLFETTAPTLTLYSIVIVSVPLLVLFFIFTPVFLVADITYRIHLPRKIEIQLTRTVYIIKSTTRSILIKPNRTQILRC